MKYKAVIFDMDGTILDTLEDITASVNAALSGLGFPTRTIEEIRRMVGNGNRKLCERAVPEGAGAETVEKVFLAFHAHYKIHSADTTRPYAGMLPLLKELKKAGVRLAVVSNKADYAVRDLCDAYFPGIFDTAAGDREGIRRKPAPDAVLEVMRTLRVSDTECVYVGDSEVDEETARNAGLPCVAVTWGFRSKKRLREQGAETFAETMEDLEKELGLPCGGARDGKETDAPSTRFEK